jgi:hypothetical protein
MEITHREDIEADLSATSAAHGGMGTPSYAPVFTVKPMTVELPCGGGRHRHVDQ